jgi:hypothetical protein
MSQRMGSLVAALGLADRQKLPVRFYCGIRSFLKAHGYDNYAEITSEEAAICAEQPGTMIIFSSGVGMRPCEIVIQD